jgi:hypothetical protein
MSTVDARTVKECVDAAAPFIKHALSWFTELKWKPIPKTELAADYVCGYGNVDAHGNGCVCIIDPVARLFQVKLVQSSGREKIVSNCMVCWSDTKTAIDRFDHYMDVTGNFLKEAWLRG